MFSVKHNECVGFESRWKVKKVYSQASSQTSESSNKDIGTNTAETVDKEVQSDQQESSVQNVDMSKLAEWLEKIYPKVKRELDDSLICKAFQGYKLIGDTAEVNCRVVQTLDISGSEKGDKALHVSAISWNSGGKLLAISCDHEHSSWCNHTGYIYFYILNRDGHLNSRPHKTFTVDSCVTELCFHPSQANILASGTYSGNIVMFNTDHDEGDSTLIKVNAHDDGITQLSWINDIDEPRTLLLASSSLDGTLSLWNANLTEYTLIVKQKYRIKSPIFGTNNADESSDIANKIVRGITCFDFSKQIPDKFVVGAEGGLVVQCSMLGANKLKGSTEFPVYDPIFMYHESHSGEINSIKFSPNRKDIFMTNATEAEIRIYTLEQVCVFLFTLTLVNSCQV